MSRITTVKRIARRYWQFARLVARRFDEDRCSRVAGALSFTTVLSLVPLTTVAFGVLSVFPVFKAWMVTVEDFIYGNFVPTAGEVVQQYMQEFATKTAGLTALGLLLVAITAIMLMATIEQAFNDIWRAHVNRKLLHRFLSYWALLTLGPILIGASLSISSYFVSLPLVTGQSVRRSLGAILLSGLPFVFEVGAFMLLYTIVPNIAVRWRDALAGSLFSAVLFELAKRGFAVFVLHFSTYQLIYGAVAVLPIFLIWIYLSWMVILLGAVVVALLPEWRRKTAA